MLIDKKQLQSQLEGILFASGEPVSRQRLMLCLDVDSQELSMAAKALMDECSFERRGIRLVCLEDSYQLVSAPEHGEIIRTVLETRKPARLSPAALEVLSIIAYYQPVTRAQVERIRGVDSSYTVSLLEQRGLIRENGHLDAPGRPALFETTPDFLRVFGLTSLEDMPPLPEEPREEGQENEAVQ